LGGDHEFLGRVGLATEILDSAIFATQMPAASPLNSVFNLLILLPSLALTVRRVHDMTAPAGG
jgi:uncharacterized membrane protein YhaH (DUF805 family)